MRTSLLLLLLLAAACYSQQESNPPGGVQDKGIETVLSVKTNQHYSHPLYIKGAKYVVTFEPVGTKDDEFWSEMDIIVNYRRIDLYDAPHGPGMNQVGLWKPGVKYDFTYLIDKTFGYTAFRLEAELLSLTSAGAGIRISIKPLKEFRGIKTLYAYYSGIGADKDKLIQISFMDTFKTVLHFAYDEPEGPFLLENKHLLKNSLLKIRYVAVREYSDAKSEEVVLNKIISIEYMSMNSLDWWNQLKDDLRKKHSETANAYLKSLTADPP